MDDLERLKVLLAHWLEHNKEHADLYREWAEKALEMKQDDIAQILERLSRETEGLNNLIEEALRLIH
jgi:hypothetical protein